LNTREKIGSKSFLPEKINHCNYDIRPMEIDQPIPHLVDESQPTPNNMTNELMKDTQQLPVQVR
jgi:hypothetical protein